MFFIRRQPRKFRIIYQGEQFVIDGQMEWDSEDEAVTALVKYLHTITTRFYIDTIEIPYNSNKPTKVALTGPQYYQSAVKFSKRNGYILNADIDGKSVFLFENTTFSSIDQLVEYLLFSETITIC